MTYGDLVSELEEHVSRGLKGFPYLVIILGEIIDSPLSIKFSGQVVQQYPELSADIFPALMWMVPSSFIFALI